MLLTESKTFITQFPHCIMCVLDLLVRNKMRPSWNTIHSTAKHYKFLEYYYFITLISLITLQIGYSIMPVYLKKDLFDYCLESIIEITPYLYIYINKTPHHISHIHMFWRSIWRGLKTGIELLTVCLLHKY